MHASVLPGFAPVGKPGLVRFANDSAELERIDLNALA
jgi:hypothetical protein